MTDVIVIDKLTKSFKGKTVLEDVNMRLQEGRIYGIVGDNGSGKTVLLKLICGFMKPDSGTVTVNGKVIGKDADFPENTGIIIEAPGFLPNYSGMKNLEYLASIRGKIGKEHAGEYGAHNGGTFTMPARDVIVTAVFTKVAEPSVNLALRNTPVQRGPQQT